MLDYNLFKKKIVGEILDFMPDEYKGYKVKIESVIKVNQKLDCLNLIPKENEECVATPNIYINHMYKEYKEHGDIKKSLEKIAYIIDYSFKNLQPEPMPQNMHELKHTLIMEIINTKENIELLKNIPHRNFLDLSIVYRCLILACNGEIGKILVDYNFMKNLNMEENEIYKIASMNTKKILPTKIRKLDEILEEKVDKEIEENSNLYVISNNMGVNGAVNMVYEEELYLLAKKVKSNLFILPSSIHEVIAVSSELEDVDCLKELVRTVNVEQVSKEERLSYNVYCYDMDKRRISIASSKKFIH